MGYAQLACVTHPDSALVQRCRENDEAAFQEIVGRYKNKLYNYLYRMTGNGDDAEDLTQEVFIRMYTSLDMFRNQSSLNTWLFRIAGNLCIDRFRRNKKHRAIAYSLDEPLRGEGYEDSEAGHEISDISFEPHRLFEQQEMTGQVQAALGKLPEKLRSVIVLYDIEGLPYEEISRIADCPLGTVKSRIFNARQQLRALLSEYLHA